MKKTLIKFILIILFSTNSSFAEIIDKITILGNKRISEETVKVLGNVSTQKDFNQRDLDKLLKSLYDTNFFSDINVSLVNGELKINLIENPIIETVEITGVKNKTFIKDILETIGLKDRMSFSEDQLEKDINTIKNVLKVNGFYFAEVTPSIIKNDELNSVRLNINIDQGKKAKIKEIQFIGNKKIKDKRLLEVIAS